MTDIKFGNPITVDATLLLDTVRALVELDCWAMHMAWEAESRKELEKLLPKNVVTFLWEANPLVFEEIFRLVRHLRH